MSDPFVLSIPSLVLMAAFVVDGVCGEPPNAFHPVNWIGRAITWMERFAPPAESRPARQVAFGLFMACWIPAQCVAAVVLLAWATHGTSWLQFVVEVIVLKSMFALRALGAAARAVAKDLKRGDIDSARQSLRHLCSRDAATLSENELAAGAIESVAENLSDSFVAPLFYWLLFGLPGAVAYRAVNTLDARIGYHGRYEYLGKPAARLDDLLNLIPSRLTAFLLFAAGFVCRCDWVGGAQIWLRDRRKTESPNAGQPMAMMAGLLRVQLTKRGCYQLGEPLENPSAPKIHAAWNIATVAAWLWLLVCIIAQEAWYATAG